MLRSRLYEYELEKKKAISRKVEDSKLGINFGSQIRSYVLQPYRIAKDHRTRSKWAMSIACSMAISSRSSAATCYCADVAAFRLAWMMRMISTSNSDLSS